MSRARVLAFDVGKTGCRAVLVEGGVRVRGGTGEGAPGLADPDGVVRALTAMTGTALGTPRVDGVVAGLAGLGRAVHRGADLGAALQEAFGADTVVLASDMTTAHAGALGGEPGAVLTAGTGAVALAVAADGTSAVVDGWGYLLGDAGSGYAIGRAGLDAALRSRDGRGGSADLRRRAEARFGDLDRLPAVVHGSPNPPRTVAAFARDVADAARDGDAPAARIWTDAGRALAETAAAAARAAGETTVVLCGGLPAAGPVLTGPFDAALAELLPGAHREPPRGDALDGALLLLDRPDLPHAALTVRCEAPR